MNVVKRVVKNTSVMLVSQIIGYIIAFFGTIYATRYLGAEGYGILATGTALTSIFAIMCDLGLGTLTIREVARDISLTNKYIVNTTLIKIILSIVMFILIVLTAEMINYSPEIDNVIYILTLSIIFNTFSGVFGSIFQAYEKMEYGSIVGILVSFLTFIGFIFAIHFNLGVLTFALVYLIVSVVNLICMSAIFLWKFFLPKRNNVWSWKLNMKVDWNFWKYILIQALPLSITIIFSTVVFKIDTVLLSIMKESIVVGWYIAAYNIMQVLMFIPSAFTVSIFPLLSTFHVSSKGSLQTTYQKSFKYLNIVGIPITVAVTLLADKIILLIYRSAFIPSILALQILIWTIPFIFLVMMFGNMFVSLNKQNLLLKILFIAMIFNIASNLLLIPQFSYIGSAVLTVISEIIIFVLCFYFLSKFICKIEFVDTLIKPVLASGIMGIFILSLKIDLLLLIPISTFVYFSVLILLKTFTKDDINLVRQIIQ